MQAHERKNALDEARRIAFGAHQIGQAFVVRRSIVQHANGQIAKASVLGKQGQKRFNRARSKSIADDHPVDVAGVEIACGGVDAQRTDETGAPGDRERQRGIGAAARHTKHGRVFEQVRGNESH